MDVAESKFENRDGDVQEFRSAYTDKQLQLLRRCRVFVESVTICVIIGSVWALLSLPTVFYFLNPYSQQVSAGQRNTKVIGCANYTKQACLQALIQSKECLFEEQQNSSNIMIAANVDQEANENTAQLVISGLPLLGATEMCRSSFIPFMCLYLFPLCEGNGTAHKPSRDQCIEISTVVCKDEWQKAVALPVIKNQLPDCETLPITTLSCEGMSTPQNTTLVPSSTLITCSDSFFLLNGSCHPECGKWKQASNSISSSIDGIVIISAAAGLAMGTAVLICSLIKRKTMFAFPSVIIAYMAVTTVTLAAFILISFVDREALYCSSQDLIEAVKTPTAFCSFIGSVYYYALLQLAIWWVCHVVALFWKVKFPFHAKTFDNVKYVHILVVVLALLLPVVPVIGGFATGGFTMSSFPPLLCVANSGDVAYYTLALPISLIVAVGTTLLIIILVIMIKHSTSLEHNAKNKVTLQTAERKIFVILCYYVILASVALAAFSLNASNGRRFFTNVIKYFACEAGGSGQTCEVEKEIFEAFTNPGINMVTFILLGALPTVNLFYILNLTKPSCIWLRATKGTSSQLSTPPDSIITE